MKSKQNWSLDGGTDPNFIRRLASNLSIYVRSRQYIFFWNHLKPSPKDKILDVGTSPDERLKDTNFFEKKYPFSNKLSIASIEDCSNIVNKYNLHEFIRIVADKRLPLKDKSFDIIVSWATIEHVGGLKSQEFYLNELCRVGKKVFITTPDRLSIYEPHTTTFFLHYLPMKYFRKILSLTGKSFWSLEKHLNILSLKSIKDIIHNSKVKVKRYKIFGLFPAHILIYGKTS